jgi:TolA-binding protein
MNHKELEMIRRLLIILLIAFPLLSAADKTTETMLEILREIGGLQEQIKGFQKSLEGKLADQSQINADQLRAAAEQFAKSMAAFSDSVQKGLQRQQDQQTKIVDAIAAAGTQLQAISDQSNTTRQAVNDLSAVVSRLTTQMNDLTALVKSMQPAKTGPPAAADQPPISATDLFANAEGDRLGGKLDLSLAEYSDYVSKFPDSPQASDAQYYIGSIHYSKQEWEEAVQAFDMLLQKYPDSRRTPESLYYKADSLAKLGRSQGANSTLKELRKRFPDSPLANQGLTVKVPK